ncbi:hypothetical protein F2Q70_00025377 [Brassica cretica]|uniref:RING-type E3 ubiquitin transferase n=1 Tax=Brassica cretica TaxID=69181 RepID=A0A8S9L1Z7_BRACR|nr:hypothetical protein F2Q70_00025377 [Brassica cretica]
MASSALFNLMLAINEKKMNSPDHYRPLCYYIVFTYSERKPLLRYRPHTRFPISPEKHHVNAVSFQWYDALKQKQKSQKIGTDLVSLSESLGKDLVVAKEGEFYEARRGSSSAVEEKRKIFSGSDHQAIEVGVLRASLHCHCRGCESKVKKYLSRMQRGKSTTKNISKASTKPSRRMDDGVQELLLISEQIKDVGTGLDVDVIDGNLNRRRYEDRSGQAEKCVICLDELKYNDDASKLACGHDFHFECIKNRLSENLGA